MPQELSRHIRDKVCKADTKIEPEEAHNLSTMSLLDLPIITDIGQDVDVTKLIISSEKVASAAAGSLAEEDYLIIGTASELGSEECSQVKNNVNSSGAEHAILWGCKQCDFRFVKETYTQK